MAKMHWVRKKVSEVGTSETPAKGLSPRSLAEQTQELRGPHSAHAT